MAELPLDGAVVATTTLCLRYAWRPWNRQESPRTALKFSWSFNVLSRTRIDLNLGIVVTHLTLVPPPVQVA